MAVVTGANSGIGKATAEGLVGHGMRVVMLCRSRERGEAARAEIVAASGSDTVDLLLCDLASLEEVRHASGELLDRYDRLDVLVNNAGGYRHSYARTEDGLETTWAVNYFAPFLLTNLLLGRLKETAAAHGEARIVNVSSDSHRMPTFELAHAEQGGPPESTYRGLAVYGATKHALILFTRELARRLGGTGVTANAVHPGMVNTAIWSHARGFLGRMADFLSFLYASPAKGAIGPLRLATDPALAGVTRRYFDRTNETKPAHGTLDDEAARRLWEVSAELVGLEDR